MGTLGICGTISFKRLETLRVRFHKSLEDFIVSVCDEWCSITGSANDGQFFYNSAIAFPTSITDTITFQEVGLRPTAWGYDGYIDFGDFYTLGNFRRTPEGVVLAYGIVKVDKNFNVLDRFYNETAIIDSCLASAAKNLDGYVFYDWSSLALIHLNVHTGVETLTSIPTVDPTAYHPTYVGDGRVAVIGDNYAEIYQYDGDGTFSYIDTKVWSTTDSDSYIGWGYSPTFNVKLTEDTIYIHDMRTSPIRRKLRAIDRETLDLRWDVDNSGTSTSGEGGTYVEEFCAVLPNGNLVGARAYDRQTGLGMLGVVEEFDKTTGNIVNSWLVDRNYFVSPSVWQTDDEGGVYIFEYAAVYRLDTTTGTLEVLFGDFYGELQVSPSVRTPLYKSDNNTFFLCDYWDNRFVVYNRTTQQKGTFDLGVTTQWDDRVLLFPIEGNIAYVQYQSNASPMDGGIVLRLIQINEE